MRAQAVRDVARSSYSGWLTAACLTSHSPDARPLDGAQRAAVARGLYAIADTLDEDEHEAALESRLSRAHGFARFVAALDPGAAGEAQTSHGAITLDEVVRRARAVLAAGPPAS